MKVIFLDVDGVLNCSDTKDRCGGTVGISAARVQFLKDIVRETDAEIVLISTWKDGWHIDGKNNDGHADYLNEMLDWYNLSVLDKTTDPSWELRGAGIISWLDSHDVESFVILDDETFDYAERHLMPRLVQTDYMNGGLLPRHAEEAIKILRTPYHRQQGHTAE